MLLRRRSLFQVEKTILPTGFQQVEYITIPNSSSAGYYNGIDPNFQFSSYNYYTMEMTVKTTGGAPCMLTASHSSPTVSSSSISDPWTGVESSTGRLGCNTEYTSLTVYNDLTTSDVSNGTKKYVKYRWYPYQSLYLHIGSWSDVTWSKTINWYSFKLYTDSTSTLSRNLYPCYCTQTVTGYRNSQTASYTSGTCGFYDLVTQRFYVNYHSGTITAGPKFVGKL